MTKRQEEFCPNWVSHPGDTIADLIVERGWTQIQLAERLGISTKHLNRLVKGRVELTNDMAIRLTTVFGSTQQFWLQREAQYRQQLARLSAEDRYRSWHNWLEEFPVAELKRAGILPKKRLSDAVKTEFVETLLTFFGIASPEQWEIKYAQMQAHFRRAQNCDSNIGALTAWLRQGETQVERMRTDTNTELPNIQYNQRKFKRALFEIRKLTVKTPKEFQYEMQNQCMNTGVFLIFVPAIPKAKVSGAARWINKKCPLIQLSLFGKSNDKFWFSFFHEAAHILLHLNEKEEIFLDDKFHSDSQNQFETEANEFAEDILISPQFRAYFDDLKTKSQLINFASEIGIHPGIVVGRLQKEGIIPYSHLNKLKVKYKFADED